MERLIPMLPVQCIATSVKFYEKLGFTLENGNDDWRWAMLRFDDCRVMIDESINPHPGTPRTGVLYLYPSDIVEYHSQLRASGIALPNLEITFYGLTEFRLDDPDHNRLWIGQDLSRRLESGRSNKR